MEASRYLKHKTITLVLPKMALQNAAKCSFGCPILDHPLEGGLPCTAVTEIFGESGTGKTQLCLQLALQAHLPAARGGLEGKCIYLYTEGNFPSRRLRQMAAGLDGSEAIGDPTDTVLVFEAFADAHDLLDQIIRIKATVDSTPSNPPVRMLIIDSIAHLFRSFDNTEPSVLARYRLLRGISIRLKAMAREHNMVIVVTNHVRDHFSPADDAGFAYLRPGFPPICLSSGRRMVPALGPSWATMTDIKLFLAKGLCNNWDTSGRRIQVPGLRLHVHHAPHVRYRTARYIIEHNGVRGLPLNYIP